MGSLKIAARAAIRYGGCGGKSRDWVDPATSPVINVTLERICAGRSLSACSYEWKPAERAPKRLCGWVQGAVSALKPVHDVAAAILTGREAGARGCALGAPLRAGVCHTLYSTQLPGADCARVYLGASAPAVDTSRHAPEQVCLPFLGICGAVWYSPQVGCVPLCWPLAAL